ncbi:uncharacterized protein KGF55_000971 [Candida pseudojiufengensis]|uniref:uncharacterized protein n=1 Tax=Candida pseudojiufengensis TaxID=497109 RepID=UPI0022247857|nr:uncharacterized protein KGF55_000971 [Candida pseudojiufengensis]KAI5965609.1 hypothetical protein KGF55_000971 [Candida pseudojiufengensis]
MSHHTSSSSLNNHNHNETQQSTLKSPRSLHQHHLNNLTPTITSDPNEVIQIISDQEKKNYRLGIILLIISIGSWICGLELVNGVLKGNEYKKPVLFAIITGSCFMINFIPDLFLIFKRKKFKKKETQPLLISPHENLEKLMDEIEPMKWKEILVLAFQISIIYLLYNIFVMEALQFTSASNQTVIGSTTSVFTLIIGILLKTEKFSIKKAVCVIVSCLGVSLVNLSSTSSNKDSDYKYEPKNPKLGNLLALVGALLYAFYLLIMRLKCGNGNKTTNERRLFGYVGIITFIMGIPILYIVDILGIEKFDFPPPNITILESILINGIFSVISDFTSILAMLLTSPLVVSLTLTSSIPITIFIDYMVLIYNHEPIHTNFIYILGILCIVVAVLLVNINITSENELIEEVIEDALENAINNDEIMSPILTPYLLNNNLNNLNDGSTSVRTNPQSIRSPISIFFSPTPKLQSSNTLYKSTSNLKIPSKITDFNLNENDESPPTHNLNHHPSLYKISNEESNGSSSRNNSESNLTNKKNLIVSGGQHHKYYIHHEE